MTGFVGVDYSTRKVAMAFLPENSGHPIVKSVEAPKRITGTEATRDVLKVFSDWCVSTLVLESHVLIEAPIVGRVLNAQTTVGMGIMAGALMQCCIDYGAASVDFVAPSYWKKNVLGHGGSDKAMVAAWLKEVRPDLDAFVDNQDEADAMCLAILSKYYTEHHVG